jgi:hypothetical protein
MSGGRRLLIHLTIALAAVMCAVIYLSGVVVPVLAAPYVNQSVVTRMDAEPTAQPTEPTLSSFPGQTAINGIPLPLIAAPLATPAEREATNTIAITSTSPSGQVMPGPSLGQVASSATPPGDVTAVAAVQPSNLGTPNAAQPATISGSFALLGSLFGGDKTLLSLIGSGGTAVVVLAVMLYWSFSYDDENVELSLDVIDRSTPLVAVYSTIETPDYGQGNDAL